MLYPIIPARAGSSLVDKNLRLWLREDGPPVPLITLAVEKLLRVFQACYVLTDSPKIAEVAAKAGACIPYLDINIDGKEDVTSTLRRFSATLGGKEQGQRILLHQCTSPQTSVETLERARSLVTTLQPEEILISVCEEPHKATAFFFSSHDEALTAAIPGLPAPTYPRQMLPKLYRYTGAITCLPLSSLSKSSFFNEHILRPLLVPEAESLDIDRESDFLHRTAGSSV